VLANILAAHSKEKRAAVILTTSTGRPWKADHFRHEWRAAIIAAGLDGLHFHDLRGTAVTMLHEAGCTTAEIASITGHSMRTVEVILEKYTARTRALAIAAMRKLEAADRAEFANWT
jgi:integrase